VQWDTGVTQGVLTCEVFNASCKSVIKHIVTINQSLPVSVTISESVNNVCAGTSVTFTADPVNGGLTPSYKWFVK